jgi:hypothetical protein
MNQPHLRPDGGFDAVWWRTALDRVARSFSPQLDLIAPFGFEVLRDPAYLRRDLKRLYVYVRVSSPDRAVLADAFAERLLAHLATEAPGFCEAIRFLLRPGARIELNPSGDRSLRISAFVGTPPMLGEYARYLVAAPEALATGTLREVADFATSLSSRRYVFQLGLMVSRLYEAQQPPLPAGQVTQLLGLIRRLAPVTSADARSPDGTEPNDAERDGLLDVVLPHARAVQSALRATVQAGGESETVRARDLHGDSVVSTTLPRGLLAEKVDYIIRSYEYCGRLL